MIVCSLQKISKMFGGTKIFENLSLEFQEGERIGLVGRNGSGKTTIMKLLSGSEQPDEGVISIKKAARLGYLAQIPSFEKGMTAEEVLRSAFSDTIALGKKMKELEERMAGEGQDLDRILAEYGTLQERFTLNGGYEMDAQVARISTGLNLQHLMDSDFETLSGGEKTKVCLGMLLLTSPDVLLLDEPTNHLDISAVEWLEEFLKEYRGTVVVISHDRYFLDEVAVKIIDLEDGEAVVYHTNYSGFVKEKEARLLEEFQAYQEQQKKIKKMKEAIKRLKEWANQANPPNEGLHKRARNMERALERMEKLKRPILERKKMGLSLESGQRSGKDVVSILDARKSFGDKSLFEGLDFQLYFQERVAIVGDNGSGKSTILKAIMGELTLDAGEVRVGSSVKAGYLSQHLFLQNTEQTVMEAFREDIVMTEGDARHVLARFLFYGPAVFRKVGQLSGGERMRLRLAVLMHQDINLLILDEPTNHLDIDSREVLEEALEVFSGTILCVSHDRYLLNKMFLKTCWLENGSLHTFPGSYDWARKKLMEMKNREGASEPVKEAAGGAKPQRDKKRSSGKRQKDISELEEEMKEVEARLSVLAGRMETEGDLNRLQKLYEEQAGLEAEHSRLYEELDHILEG
ncbi:ribosomal protection-like ABC-F family protein [Peribacillus sp. SCS-37]|uniref:ribosomal protection-like ABC-F family protein n=1 Tax=Paraperibacillus esterisolvens TaxID=3115296 RepID=UPI0039068AEE